MDFTEFNLHEDLLNGLETAGYVTCTPVQEAVLKTALDGSDLYVQSQTGTGKTAAYLVSILQELLASPDNAGKKVLILLPTRELAVQVEEEAKKLTSGTQLKAFSFYGGVGYERQIASLKKGVDIIIGTPGRMIDLQQSRQLDLSNVGFLVVDEADRMFDMGFYPDLRTLLKVLPKAEDRQTMLFSATLNSYVKNLAWEYTRDAKEITIESDTVTVEQIDQELLHVSSDEKMKLLVGILAKEKPESVLVFCNTKRSCEVVSKRLVKNGFKSEFIIGDLPQAKRLQVLNRFKDGSVSILVATDVAARGIDVHDLAMVVNYDLPNESENYVHRIGRTARAGKTGKAYTFCSEQDVYNLPAIERYIEMQIPSRVADASMLGVDASEGVYIRTENWREDYEGGRSSSRRGGTGGGKFSGRRDSKKSDARSGSRGRRKTGSASERPTFRKERFTEDDTEKLQSMSFEERMKLYKEKYAKSASALTDGKGGSSSESKGAKPFSKKDRAKTGRKNDSAKGQGASRSSFERGRQDVQKPSAAKKRSGVQRYDESKKGLQSQSLWHKIKSLFGKK